MASSRVRRTKESIQQDRTRSWTTLSYEGGYALYTMCLACGRMSKCKGTQRHNVRCETCYMTNARLMFDILGGPRKEDDGSEIEERPEG
jgi:hypothetical protein